MLHICRMVLQESASLDGIANLIEGHVPDAKRARLYGRELSYVLPRDHVDRYNMHSIKMTNV